MWDGGGKCRSRGQQGRARVDRRHSKKTIHASLVGRLAHLDDLVLDQHCIAAAAHAQALVSEVELDAQRLGKLRDRGTGRSTSPFVEPTAQYMYIDEKHWRASRHHGAKIPHARIQIKA